MPKCVFLTISNTEGWFIDDDLVHEPLKKLGWQIKNIPWDKETDWNEYDLVIIRSPWDYQDHLDQFFKVLKNIDESNAILLNSLKIVQWNINKEYLSDLEKKGGDIVPTIRKTGIKRTDILHAFDTFKTEEIIVKPMIGANADDTYRISKEKQNNFNEIEKVFSKRPCMIQPFMNNIIEEGEFSLIYFDGVLSHTILKTAEPGDFRVQEEHGGGVIAIKEPEQNLVASADKFMNMLEEKPLYSRVDLVRTPENSFALMELELIEPCLYFRFHSKSAESFAACIDKYWENQLKNRIEM